MTCGRCRDGAIERDAAHLRKRVKELAEEAKQLRAARDRVIAELIANGCECECGHAAGECDESCERCLGCRVEAALRSAAGGEPATPPAPPPRGPRDDRPDPDDVAGSFGVG